MWDVGRGPWNTGRLNIDQISYVSVYEIRRCILHKILTELWLRLFYDTCRATLPPSLFRRLPGRVIIYLFCLLIFLFLF